MYMITMMKNDTIKVYYNIIFMARLNTLSVVLGLLLIAALVFIFVELPDHCDDHDKTFHNHCHHLRDAGINCRPGSNCWDDSLGDSTPGTTGWVIIGAVVLLLGVGLAGGCEDRAYPPPVYAPRYYAPQPPVYRVKSKATKAYPDP